MHVHEVAHVSYDIRIYLYEMVLSEQHLNDKEIPLFCRVALLISVSWISRIYLDIFDAYQL